MSDPINRTPPVVLAMGTPFVDYLAKVKPEFMPKLPGAHGGSLPLEEDRFAEFKGFLKQNSKYFHDIRKNYPTLPPEDIQDGMMLAAGGSSSNTLRGLQSLGLDCRIIGKKGTDSAAKRYVEAMERLGVDTFLFEEEGHNAQCYSFVEDDGRRTMRAGTGVGGNLKPAEISESPAFDGISHFHSEGYNLYNPNKDANGNGIVKVAMEKARVEGATISFDMSSKEVITATWDQMLPLIQEYVDVVFCNEDEAAAIAKLQPDLKKESSEETERTVAEWLSQQVKGTAIVCLGPRGCLLGQQGRVVLVETTPVARVEDTTGAGDQFAAGFLYGQLMALDPETSARLGCYLGGEMVKILGAVLEKAIYTDALKAFSTCGNSKSVA